MSRLQPHSSHGAMNGSFKDAAFHDGDGEEMHGKQEGDASGNSGSSNHSPHTSSMDNHLDLVFSVKGLYRIFDLVSEQGSGGPVDKVVISQNSLKAFIDIVCPGAYVSITKVDFKALDQYIVKPVGVYGSKEEIVRFLSELRVVDASLAAQLLADPSTAGPTQPTLRSGLYFLRPTEQYGQTEQIFVVYWPQENTWDDCAPSQVRQNRVIFMRYLTKMCDQVIALISSAHARTIVWSDGDEDNARDRIINCVVDRKTEEESVQVREGFKVASGHITYADSALEGSVEQGPTKPFLLFGETAQGFMTIHHQPAEHVCDAFMARSFTTLQLEGYLMFDRLCLDESLDDKALGILIRSGLKKRFPPECANWAHGFSTIDAECKRMRTGELAKMRATLDKEEESLTSATHEAVVDIVLNLYPFLERESFPYSRVRQTTTSVPFREIVSTYPGINASKSQHDVIGKAVISNLREDKVPLVERAVSYAASVFSNPREDKIAFMDRVLREALSKANDISDSRFLKEIVNAEVIQEDPELIRLVQEANMKLQLSLATTISRVVKKLVTFVRHTQEEIMMQRIKAAAKSREEQEKRKLRLQLIRHVNM